MIKLKSLLVIILSSILISCVLLLTILGLSLYIGWKEAEAARVHKSRIASLNARSYEKYISISDMRARQGKDGIYEDKFLLEGSLKNNGYRTVNSIELDIDFLNSSDESIYMEKILPLRAVMVPRKTTIAALSQLTSGKETPLLPGESHAFKHILNDQKNKSIVSPIKDKRYATNPNEWSGRFKYRITKIIF